LHEHQQNELTRLYGNKKAAVSAATGVEHTEQSSNAIIAQNRHGGKAKVRPASTGYASPLAKYHSYVATQGKARPRSV